MPIGTVKWFDPTKGFGFIQPDGGAKDVFVHISAVERVGMANLGEGRHVRFGGERNPMSGKTAAANLEAV